MREFIGRSPVTRAYLRMTASALRVVAYHGISDTEAFARQIAHVQRRYRPVSLDDVHAALHGGRALPDRAILITFDDGDRTVFESGLPILAAAGIPAVLYVVTDLIDTEQPFWWQEATSLFERGARPDGSEVGDTGTLIRAMKLMPDEARRSALAGMRKDASPVTDRQLTGPELRQLESDGITIGNHTSTHPCLDRCKDQVLEAEIERAHHRLTELLGREPDTFAYPNGNLDLRAEPLLRRLGYRSAFLFDHALQRFPADHLRISRLRVNADLTVGTFDLMASGTHALVHRRVLRRP